MRTPLFPIVGITSVFSPLAFAGAVPQYDHVVIVVEENHSYSQITSQFASSAPYINNTLIAQGASLTKMYGMEHPSQGNYLWMFSGSNQNIGFTNNDVGPFNTPNLGAGLIGAGYSFKGYSEDLPAIGSTVSTSGAYARKHNPWVNFSNVPNGNTVATSSNLRMTDFPTDFTQLPTVSIVVPNQDNDMHNGTDPQTIATGDAWLQSKINAYYTWAKQNNSLLIVTWDESAGGGAGLTNPAANENQIATVFGGAGVAHGAFSEGNGATLVNLLRTVESMYGLSPSGAQSAPATAAGIGNGAISDVFQQWKSNVSGNWSDGANWVGGVAPGGYGSTVNLLSGITSNQTITTTGQTLHVLNIDNPNRYTIAGSGTLYFDGPNGPHKIRVASGSHQIDVPVWHQSGQLVAEILAGATLTLTAESDGSATLTKTGGGELRAKRFGTGPFNVGPLTVNGGTLTVSPGGTTDSTSNFYLTGISNGAVIDLNDNDALVRTGNGSTVAQTRAYLKAGYNNGNFNGTNGIISTAARIDPLGNKTLGLLTGAEFTANNGAATFSGRDFSPGDSLIKYTYFGDVDFNGSIDASDYNLIDFGFVNRLTGWANGDADYSGTVDVSDYNLIDYAFATQNGVVLRAMSYLEGYDRSMNGMSDPSLQIVAQHFKQFGEDYRTGFLSHAPEPASAGVITSLSIALVTRRRRCASRRR